MSGDTLSKVNRQLISGYGHGVKIFFSSPTKTINGPKKIRNLQLLTYQLHRNYCVNTCRHQFGRGRANSKTSKTLLIGNSGLLSNSGWPRAEKFKRIFRIVI